MMAVSVVILAQTVCLTQGSRPFHARPTLFMIATHGRRLGLDETRLEMFFDDDLQQYILLCHLTEEKILLPAVGTWRLGFD